MTKITLVGVRPYKIIARPGTKNAGTEINGFSYVGFLEDGKAISFTSRIGNHPVHLGSIGYDPNKAAELVIDVKLFAGVVKYAEHFDASSAPASDEEG